MFRKIYMRKFQRGLLHYSSSACNFQNHSDVLIIGAGPTGMFLSTLLSQYGIYHTIVDKRTAPTTHPQAHFINNRSMEILQTHVPDVFHKILKYSPPSENWRDFTYCYSLTGHSFLKTDHFDKSMTSPLFWKQSPTSITHLPQNRFETFFREEFHKDISKEYCHTYFGYTLDTITTTSQKTMSLSIRPVQSSISSTNINTKDRHSTHMNDIIHFNQSKYIIAADGAHSQIRQYLNIPMIGEESLQTLLNVHFICHGLRQLLEPRLSMLYFIFNEVTVSVMVAHDPELDEWVCQIPIFEPKSSSSSSSTSSSSISSQSDETDKFAPYMNEDDIMKKLKASIGISLHSTPSPWSSVDSKSSTQRQQQINNLSIEILSIRKWSMHAQVASTFSHHITPVTPVSSSSSSFSSSSSSASSSVSTHSSPTLSLSLSIPNQICQQQHIFLVGDSAHRFPPAGGFGMNTGLQDAHNLAWKLQYVIQGQASESLLRTYDTERRPVAQANTALSLRNYKKTARTAASLGVDPQLAKLALQMINSTSTFLSYQTTYQMLQTLLNTGLKPLYALQTADNIYSRSRIYLLQQQYKKSDMLPLIFPQYDLNFIYPSHRIDTTTNTSSSSSALSRSSNSTSSRQTRQNHLPEPIPSEYQKPILRIGCRIPHIWLLFQNKPFINDNLSTEEITTTTISADHRVPIILSTIQLSTLFSSQLQQPNNEPLKSVLRSTPIAPYILIVHESYQHQWIESIHSFISALKKEKMSDALCSLPITLFIIHDVHGALTISDSDNTIHEQAMNSTNVNKSSTIIDSYLLHSIFQELFQMPRHLSFETEYNKQQLFDGYQYICKYIQSLNTNSMNTISSTSTSPLISDPSSMTLNDMKQLIHNSCRTIWNQSSQIPTQFSVSNSSIESPSSLSTYMYMNKDDYHYDSDGSIMKSCKLYNLKSQDSNLNIDIYMYDVIDITGKWKQMLTTSSTYKPHDISTYKKPKLSHVSSEIDSRSSHISKDCQLDKESFESTTTTTTTSSYIHRMGVLVRPDNHVSMIMTDPMDDKWIEVLSTTIFYE